MNKIIPTMMMSAVLAMSIGIAASGQTNYRRPARDHIYVRQVVTPAPSECARGEVIYGPVSGTVTEESNNPIGQAPEPISASDFELTITFSNPESEPWDYGIAFTDTRDGSVDVVGVRNDGVWIHARRNAARVTGYEVIDGNSLLALKIGSSDLNEFTLIARDRTVELHINQSLIAKATLDIAPGDPELIEPVLGFNGGDVSGTVTYENFTIRCS